MANDLIDFDMCWAFELADPWQNLYELNCYDYDRIKRELTDGTGIDPSRYWPVKLYHQRVVNDTSEPSQP